MPPKIAPTTLTNITNHIQQGLSTRKIASKVGVSHTTVARIRRATPNTPTPSVGGRTSKLSDREKREVANLIRTKKAMTAVEATNIINQGRENKVCSNTVRTALRQMNLVARIVKKAPPTSQ